MSGNIDEEKGLVRSAPLDLARSQISSLRTVEAKAPLVMTGQSLRGMRVLTQNIPALATSLAQNSTASTLITTNIVPQTVSKQDPAKPQITNIITSGQAHGSQSLTLQRTNQITLTTTPVIAQGLPFGSTYHVPRGPAVVANLAAPRSNVGSVRAPMIVTAQTPAQGHFARASRTPSPASATAWLTTNSSSNGSQLKSAPTAPSQIVRSATLTGKHPIIGRNPPAVPSISSIRSGTTLLHSAITIGQPGQLQPFKPGQNATSVQVLGTAVTISQVQPARTQVVYNPNSTTHFTTASKISIPNAVHSRQSQPSRSVQVTSARIAVPLTQGSNRLMAPQAAVLASGTRISALSTQPLQSVSPRVMAPQPNVGRISVATNPIQVTSANLLQGRIPINLQPLVVPNSQTRTIQSSVPKAPPNIQPSSSIHLSSSLTSLKTTSNIVSNTTRTINVSAAMVTQRPTAVVSSQAIQIGKVITQSFDNQNIQNSNIFLQGAVPTIPRHSSPGPTTGGVSSSTIVPTTTVATYTLPTGTFFYNATDSYSVARSFGQTTAVTAPYVTTQHPPLPQQSIIKPSSLNTTSVHPGLVASQQMRFNPAVMVVEQSRGQQQPQPYSAQHNELIHEQSQAGLTVKATASPRPKILRKRDHEGSPLKAAKNLTPVLTSLPHTLISHSLQPHSPPSRPDSRGNGHSSGGSTTISATSSPGIGEVNEDSMPAIAIHIKEEDDVKPPMEMSPRKKPRKQQLTGNDLDEMKDEMQFITENSIKKELHDYESKQALELQRLRACELVQIPAPTVRKPATASLLNSYKQTWKATHNHFVRYSDVKPKDERRPTIMDLANQYRVQEKANGWKVHHLSTQMEDLAEQEELVYSQLSELLKCTESEENKFDKDINRINELIKGNLQRIKIINDGMIEAKTQIMKIFDHKVHVTDIINRCASKRNFKKREKS